MIIKVSVYFYNVALAEKLETNMARMVKNVADPCNRRFLDKFPFTL